MSKQKPKIDYDFKPLTPYEYELTFLMKASSKSFNYIFTQAKEKLNRKGVKVTGSPDSFNRIDIEPKFYKLIKTILNKKLNQLFKEIQKDKIEVLTSNVIKSFFERDKDGEWIITIKLGGDYADKR